MFTTSHSNVRLSALRLGFDDELSRIELRSKAHVEATALRNYTLNGLELDFLKMPKRVISYGFQPFCTKSIS
jgi:hypothetical protein